MKFPTTRIWLVLGVALLLSAGCALDKKEKAGDDSDDARSGGLVSTPTVVLTGVGNSTDYQVMGAALGMSTSTSDYVYGAIQLKYLGSTDRIWVNVNATFKDAAGKTLWTDYSYFRNLTSCGTASTGNTDTFFTPANNTAFYKIIEDIGSFGISAGDVARVELSISHSAYTYLAPTGHLSKVGGVTKLATGQWSQNVTNDGSVPVDNDSSALYLADAQGRVYQWSFTDLYSAGVQTSSLTAGATGQLQTWGSTPDYLTAPLTPSTMTLAWDVPSPSPNTVAASLLRSASALEDGPARDMVFLEALNEATAAQAR